jgi:hypothetical protein
MQTWWQSTGQQSLLTVVLVGAAFLALFSPGVIAAPSDPPRDPVCGYIKAIPWRDVDPQMAAPIPRLSREPTATPGPSPQMAPASTATPSAAAPPTASPERPDCHPLPPVVPINPAAP